MSKPARIGFGLAGGLALAACLLAACISDRPDPLAPIPDDGEAVAIQNFSYVPPALTVEVGTPIVWTNEDAVPHSVTAVDGSFDSAILTGGQRYQLAPTTAGTFPYFCTVHPNTPSMRGTLTVIE